MSSDQPPSDQCALAADGTLKDASEIEWQHSEDEAQGPPKATTSQKGKARLTPSNAAEKIGGARRARKQTWKALGEDPLGTSATVKRLLKPKGSASSTPSSAQDKAVSSSSLAAASKRKSDEVSEGGDTEPDEVPQPSKPNKGKAKAVSIVLSDDEDEEVHPAAEEESGGEEDGDEQYEKMRVEVESERRPAAKRRRTDATIDIRGIFKPDEKTLESGVVEKGHCDRKRPAWFTGSSSTLRAHVSRNWKTHGEAYLKKCRDNGVDPNPRALPEDAADDETGATPAGNPSQSTLNGYVKNTPAWTSEGLLSHIVETIAVADLPFQIVERSSFRALLKFQRPQMKDSDIPHRTKIRKTVLELAETARDRLKAQLKNIPGQASITFDAWTSDALDAYLTISAHYITAPKDRPDEWTLEARVIGFTKIDGNHSGANIANVIIRVVDRYDLRDKLGWATSDNATANDACMRALERLLNDPQGRRWEAKQRRGRCMEHVLHLAAKAFIETVCPSPSGRGTGRTNQQATVEDEDDDDYNWAQDEFGVDIQSLDETEFAPGDVLSKVLGLINQARFHHIRASPQAREYFATVCAEEKITPLQLIKWIRTRWGSMHDLIERVLVTKPAVNKFCRLADDSDRVPDLTGGKTYGAYSLEKREWELLELICEVLKELRGAQASFSSETSPTVWRAIPILECVQDRWETMSRASRFAPVKHGLEAGLAKLKTYYRRLDQSDMYFTCLALDPRVKDVYAKENWDSNYYDAGMRDFRSTFLSYASKPTAPASPAQVPTTPSAPATSSSQASAAGSSMSSGYASSWMRKTLLSRMASDREAHDPFAELVRYFNAPLAHEDVDPIAWWGHHAREFPILARMARDYLAIQGSAVASERAFSSGGRTGTARRNRLKPDTFGALQILKDAYRTGLMGSAEEAARHAADLLWDGEPM